MTRNQVLRMIELPLSLSVIIGGIRIALVVAIGVVAVGSFIGCLHLVMSLFVVRMLLMVHYLSWLVHYQLL